VASAYISSDPPQFADVSVPLIGFTDDRTAEPLYLPLIIIPGVYLSRARVTAQIALRGTLTMVALP
jgi:hypothetical protein